MFLQGCETVQLGRQNRATSTYETTRRHKPEGRNSPFTRCEQLKSHFVRTCCGVRFHSNCYNRSIDQLSRGSPWFFFQIGNLCGRQDADVTATAHVLYTSVRTRRGRVLLFALQSLIVSACWQDLIALFSPYVWIFPVVQLKLGRLQYICCVHNDLNSNYQFYQCK